MPRAARAAGGAPFQGGRSWRGVWRAHRTMAFFLAIFLVPSARQVVITAGRPSGMAATASATWRRVSRGGFFGRFRRLQRVSGGPGATRGRGLCAFPASPRRLQWHTTPKGSRRGRRRTWGTTQSPWDTHCGEGTLRLAAPPVPHRYFEVVGALCQAEGARPPVRHRQHAEQLPGAPRDGDKVVVVDGPDDDADDEDDLGGDTWSDAGCVCVSLCQAWSRGSCQAGRPKP